MLRARQALPGSTSPFPARRPFCHCSTRYRRKRARSERSTPSSSMADGRTTGHNTDRIGFRRAFEDALGARPCRRQDGASGRRGWCRPRRRLRPLRPGRSMRCWFMIRAWNAARRLADELVSAFGAGRGEAVADAASALSDAAGLVNATPVGMLGIPGMPVPLDAIAAHHWVADVIYTPLETDLIKAARAKGCKVDGRGRHVRASGGRNLPAVHRTHGRSSAHATHIHRSCRSREIGLLEGPADQQEA